MFRWFVRWLGFRLFRRAVASRNGTAVLDFGLGLALLRSAKVPVLSKFMALALGFMAIAVLIALEAPLEGLIALLLNVPGIGLDLMVDGLEILAGPVLIGSLLLVHLAPPHLVASLRQARQRPAVAG